jgi:pSer/pThr/pTyr-binding forkhead associated (FHA) protein
MDGEWGGELALEYTIALLRLSVVAGLYLFLLLVVAVIARDLRRAAPTSSAQVSTLGRLIVVASEAEAVLVGRAFDLSPVTTIGRDSTNVVVLPDSFLSGEHAMLSWREKRWWLDDLGSTNGTWLNGQPVRSPSPFAFGGTLQVGRVTLKLVRE